MLYNTKNDLPNVRLSAQASNDGKRVTVIFPQEFIGETVKLDKNQQGRGIIRRNPMFGGKDVIGRVGPDGVKFGAVDFNPSEIGLNQLFPGMTNVWWAKQYENALLIGSLISDLSTQRDPANQPQPEIDGMVFGEKLASGEHSVNIEKWPMSMPDEGGRVIKEHSLPEQKHKEIYNWNTPLQTNADKPLTIEEAVAFVNEWASKPCNNATLIVEDNKLFIEIRRRIGQ